MINKIRNLGLSKMLICITLAFYFTHAIAASDTNVEKSLELIQGDDVIPSEARFNYIFTCAGFNRVIELNGRNYFSEAGKPRSEITRIQINGRIVSAADLDAINKLIFDSEGSSIHSPIVKCNNKYVTYYVRYGKLINKKPRNLGIEVMIDNDGKIKIEH